MGLKLNRDWFQVVHKTRVDDAERVRQGHRSRLTPPILPSNLRSEVKTSPQAEEMIAGRCTKRDSSGQPMVHTARGRRRHQRRMEGKQ